MSPHSVGFGRETKASPAELVELLGSTFTDLHTSGLPW